MPNDSKQALRLIPSDPQESWPDRLGHAVACAMAPMIERLEQRVVRIESRVTRFVPRKAITETVKRRHREAVHYLGGRCPCCGETFVVDEEGKVIPGAEYDHFYSRERRGLAETWLICRPCHKRLGNGRRSDRIDEFRTYQRRARQLESKQAELPL